jgi:hypothetical protein
MGCPHAAEATETASPEATEAATAATPRRIASAPTHGYEPTREARWRLPRVGGADKLSPVDSGVRSRAENRTLIARET